MIVRTYCSFTMEIILATAFGRMIDIQRGESDELTKVTDERFRQMDEGQLTSRDGLVMVISEFLKCTQFGVCVTFLPVPLSDLLLRS